MSNCRKSGFRDKVRDRQPERHIHRNAQRILNNQDLDFKLSREIIKRTLEMVADRVNQSRDVGVTFVATKDALVDPIDI